MEVECIRIIRERPLKDKRDENIVLINLLLYTPSSLQAER